MLTPINSLLECKTRNELAELLKVDIATLTYFAYGSGRRYSTFEVPKKSGGTRTISAPIDGLLEIQRRLAEQFTKVYPDIPYVHGFINGRSVRTNATYHLNKNQILNIDLKDFFPSITSNRIIGLLRAKPFSFDNKMASAIAGLTCYNGSLPQGAPTSPILSNMICLRMDKSFRMLCRKDHIAYSRYADDLTFSYRKKLPPYIAVIDEHTGAISVGSELMRVIQINNFELNSKKTRISRNGQAKYVTGVKVNISPNLPRQYVRQIRNMLNAWGKYGLNAAQDEFEKKYNAGNRKFINVISGKIAYLKSIKTDSDLTYARLYNKFVDLEGKNRTKIPITEIEKLLPKVFVIESMGKQGTGFIVNKEWLLTCSHVVANDPVISDYFIHTDYHRATRKKVRPHEEWRSPEEEYDIIALPFNTRDSTLTDKSFDLAPPNFEVEAGMRFRIVGFPAYEPGSPPHTMTIEVTALRRNGKYIHAYVSQKMIGGYSGCPVLNEKNQVVGIVQRGTATYQSGDNSIGYTFLPIQEMRKYLAMFNETI